MVEGQIQALWAILAARGLSVDPATRARVEACQDPAVLARWIARAMTAATAADVSRRPLTEGLETGKNAASVLPPAVGARTTRSRPSRVGWSRTAGALT
jgi:hypothetical protein